MRTRHIHPTPYVKQSHLPMGTQGNYWQIYRKVLYEVPGRQKYMRSMPA